AVPAIRAAWSDAPSVAPAPDGSNEADDAGSALRRGLDQERARNWSGAIETYREALEHWPSGSEFRRRLRLCEIHFRLHRRYAHTSFCQVLLPLSQSQATDLYDEVLERIQSNYVDTVPMDPLVRHGLDNLEVALRDPDFIRANVSPATADRISGLRDT